MIDLYLRARKPVWLTKTDAPIVLTAKEVRDRKRLPQPRGRWALDAGSLEEMTVCTKECVRTKGDYDREKHIFTQASVDHAPHMVTTQLIDFVDLAYRCHDEMGNLEWITPPNWPILEVARLDVPELQRRTVETLVRAKRLAPDLPFVPVLHGTTVEEYVFMVQLLEANDVDPRETVVCIEVGARKSWELEDSIKELANMGLRLHALHAVTDKTHALTRYAKHIVSADTQAWLPEARTAQVPGHTHKDCTDCVEFALGWRQNLLGRIGSHQMALL